MKKLLILGLVLLMTSTAFALSERGDHTFTGDIWLENNVEVDGTIDLDDATITATEKITSTHILNVTRTETLSLGSFVGNNSAGVATRLGNATSPQMVIVDGIPALVWENEGAVSPAKYTFRVDDNYVSGLSFRILATTSTMTTAASYSIDWALWVNADGLLIDAARFEQTAVPFTTTTTTGTCEELTFTMNATAAAAISAGSIVTLDIFNASTDTGRLEVKNVQKKYTSTM